MLPAAFEQKVERRGRAEPVAGGKTIAVIVGVRDGAVDDDRIFDRCRIGEPAGAISVADGIGCPQIGLEIDPAALRLPFVFRVIGLELNLAERPLHIAEGIDAAADHARSEEHTSELQSLMRISYAVFCLKKKKTHTDKHTHNS